MNDINEVFRDHVTSGAFTITLRKTHIEAFVFLDWRLTWDATIREELDNPNRVRHPTAFVSGCRGLMGRGLVLHHDPYPPRTDTSRAKFFEFYTITQAGDYVIALLQEAGVWQEYAAGYPAVGKAVTE